MTQEEEKQKLMDENESITHEVFDDVHSGVVKPLNDIKESIFNEAYALGFKHGQSQE